LSDYFAELDIIEIETKTPAERGRFAFLIGGSPAK
jgi:hypothetical protein